MSVHNKMKILTAVLAVAFCVYASVAQAGFVYFVADGGDYNVAANWSTGSMPTVGDTAVIGDYENSHLDYSAALSNDSSSSTPNYLYIGYGTGGTLTLNTNAVLWTSLYVGVKYAAASVNGDGTVNHNGGSVAGGGLVIGTYEGDVGLYTISGGLLDISANSYVGHTGNGTLNVDGGAVALGGSVQIGRASTSASEINQTAGSITIGTTVNNQLVYMGGRNTGNYDGGQGTWDISGGTATVYGTINVGQDRNGTGEIIQSAGTLTATTGITLGIEANAAGSIDLSGGTLNAGALNVGSVAGTTSSVDQSGGDLYAASVDIKGGAVTVSGGTLHQDSSSGNFRIGLNSTGGVLNIQDAGAVSAVRDINVGNGPGIQGAINQTGGSLTTTGNVVIGLDGSGRYDLDGGDVDFDGWLHVGYNTGGSGVVDQTAGTLVAAGLSLNGSGAGEYDISGGSAEFGTILVGASRVLNQSGGELTATNGGAVSGTATISGGTFRAGETAGTFQVAGSGGGQLNIQNTAAVYSRRLCIGANASGVGQVDQTGGAANVTILIVGEYGAGTYNLSSGTLNITGPSTSWPGIYLAYYGGSTGTFNFTGGTIDMNGNGIGAIGGAGAFNFKGGTLKNVANVDAAVTLQSGGAGAVFHQEEGFNGRVAGKISGGVGLTKTGAGTLSFAGDNDYAGLTVIQGGVLALEGIDVATAPGAWDAVFNLGGADIQAGGLVFDYSGEGGVSPATTVLAILDAGYDVDFASGQIHSSPAASAGMALGWIDDDANSLLAVQYALYGDATLDDKVDADDLTKVLTNYNSAGVWATGDFTYDGLVDADDLTKVLTNYNSSLIVGTVVPGNGLDAEAIAMLAAAGFTVVPEPSTLALLAAGLIGMLVYAWRKRK